MISLPVGVRIVKFYDAEIQKVGKGVLYLLSSGIMFEKKGEGAKFECGFEYLASYEAAKKDKLLVVIRTPQGRKSVEFKVDAAKQVEDDISKVNREYADSSDLSDSKNNEKQTDFDQESHSRSEAKWFKDNWNEIMKFLKPEKVEYLNEYIKNAKTGSPNADPYLLVVKYENLTYKDFANLPGFLNWRYPEMNEKEVEMMVKLFGDFEEFSVRTLEMQTKRAISSNNYKKFNRSLFEHIAINSREIEEDLKSKNIKT
ncbi:MAG: hypothetical protein KGH88_06540 [Thaumarchaeota archaeon]|nr:hypothetical protein [Nitrososphaerota archaeon]